MNASRKLEILKANLPTGDIEEKFVYEYHAILTLDQEQTSEDLSEYFIPESELKKCQGIQCFDDYGELIEASYSSKRYCDRNFFMYKLDKAIEHLSSANLDAQVPDPPQKTTYSLPKIPLTEPEHLWLREVYESFKKGEEVEIKALKVKLRGRIPIDFEPRKIDDRLLRLGRLITLYGIWHVDPDTDLLYEADLVIRTIGKLISDDTKRETVTSEEVANLTDLPKSKVEFLIKEIRLLGFFWTDVERASDAGYSEVKVKDEDVFNKYYQYEGIEKLINELNEAQPVIPNEQTKIKYSLPKIDLSAPEQQWLGTICQQFLNGYMVDVDQLKKSWRAQGKWPAGFRLSEIDYRLLQGNKPTLLGIYHAYPENEWIEKCDLLVKYIKHRISNSTSAEIKVADIAKAIGVTERSVSILIHLLPSIGLYYKASGSAIRHDRVKIPGEIDMYHTLHLDDPEKIDDYLSYENIEEQIEKVYNEGRPTTDSSSNTQQRNESELIQANELYRDVIASTKAVNQLDETEIRILIEKAEDAIKLFGSSNQDKKAELRRIKQQLERGLPPESFTRARERVEASILSRIWRRRSTRILLIAAILLIIVIPVLYAIYTFVSPSTSNKDKTSSAPQQSPSPVSEVKPTVEPPKSSSSPAKNAGDTTQAQAEIDKAYNAVSQMRVGMRAGLDQLLQLKANASDENVRQRVKSLLENVTSDYERVATERLQDGGPHSAVSELYSEEVQSVVGKPGLTAAIVKVIRTDKDLMQVAFAFLALRETTSHRFRMFDFEEVEQWCGKHPSECK